MDSFQGKKLNAPNDIVVHTDGAIWFSASGLRNHGKLRRAQGGVELPTAVYRLDPKTREAAVVVGDLR